MKLFRRGRAEALPARQARQRRLAEEDHEEIVQVCADALYARWIWVQITGFRATRAGLIVRSENSVKKKTGYVMLGALTPLGYVAEPYQKRKGTCEAVLVTGTDPLHRLDGRAAEDIEETISVLTTRLAYIGHITGGGQ